MKTRKNWDQRIAEAKERGMFHLDDRAHASHWASCAVGERRGIPRNPAFGFPLNESLYVLGTNFYDAVIVSNMALAEKLLRAIKARAKEVRKELRNAALKEGA